MIIINIHNLLRLYIYLHYFHGIYVALSFIRYIIENLYNGSIYIISYFQYDIDIKQINDKKIEIEEIDDGYLIIS